MLLKADLHDTFFSGSALRWLPRNNFAMAEVAAISANDLGVKENYEHAPKRVTPGESIEMNGAVLKWYALSR